MLEGKITTIRKLKTNSQWRGFTRVGPAGCKALSFAVNSLLGCSDSAGFISGRAGCGTAASFGGSSDTNYPVKANFYLEISIAHAEQ